MKAVGKWGAVRVSQLMRHAHGHIWRKGYGIF